MRPLDACVLRSSSWGDYISQVRIGYRDWLYKHISDESFGVRVVAVKGEIKWLE